MRSASLMTGLPRARHARRIRRRVSAADPAIDDCYIRPRGQANDIMGLAPSACPMVAAKLPGEDMPLSVAFDVMAPFYDWEHADFTDDVEMYTAFARRTGGPALELACGTGRLVLPMARRGIPVVGLERSWAMLRIAHSKLQQAGPLPGRVWLVQGDMRRFKFRRRFSLIVLSLDSFALLTERADQIATLEHVRQHLDHRGLLVMDVSNGNQVCPEEGEQVVHSLTRRHEESGSLVTKWGVLRVDPARQVFHYLFFYDQVPPGGLVSRNAVEVELRYFTRSELELLLERAGLDPVEAYGDYGLSPFRAGSPRLIMVARPG